MTIHVVKPGESVYSIAAMYKVPIERIISDNGLTDPKRLAVGQALVIRYPAEYHIVEPGQSLSSIAAMHHMTVQRLYQLNPKLEGVSHVESGQVLILSLTQEPVGEMEVNGYAYPNIDRTILRKTLPYLTYLSVFSYGFDANTGALVQLDDEELVRIIREYSTIPVLVLTTIGEDGHFSSDRVHILLNNEQAQKALMQNLLVVMQEKGYGGVDVDFEYIPPEDAVQYAAFVKKLRLFFNPHGIKVMVGLAPKSSAQQQGLLYEAHDYRALGEAANYVLLMTYEWGYSRSAPMAVAPINKVQQVVQYAVTEIPTEKIFMGVPNYGYDWTLPYVQGESVARSLGNVEAVDQAIAENAMIEYDWTAQSPFYKYWRAQTEHEVWFEDARSIQAKLNLANSYDLNGIGVWSLMRWFPQLWMVLSSLYSINKYM